MPLWAVLAADAAIVGLWLVDFRIPDPFRYSDEIILGAVGVGTAVYVWRRFFGPPGAISAAARRRVAEIEILFEECRRAAASLPGAAGEVERLSSLLEKVRVIEERLEQTETVLLSPEYDLSRAAAEVDRLRAQRDSASGATRENLEGAVLEAQKHVENVKAIYGTRDELSAAFERIYQLVRRIHSQIVGAGLAHGQGSALSTSVDELASTLAEYEREQAVMARAEKIAEKEIAEAEEAASAGKPGSSRRGDLH